MRCSTGVAGTSSPSYAVWGGCRSPSCGVVYLVDPITGRSSRRYKASLVASRGGRIGLRSRSDVRRSWPSSQAVRGRSRRRGPRAVRDCGHRVWRTAARRGSGRRAEDEPVGDFLVGQPLGHERQHLPLTIGQRVQHARVAWGSGRFVRPGAVRIGTTTSRAGLAVNAFRNSDGSTDVVVLNSARNRQAASFSLHGLRGAHVTPYLTDTSHQLSPQSGITVSNSGFTATLPPRSLVTYDIRP